MKKIKFVKNCKNLEPYWLSYFYIFLEFLVFFYTFLKVWIKESTIFVLCTKLSGVSAKIAWQQKFDKTVSEIHFNVSLYLQRILKNVEKYSLSPHGRFVLLTHGVQKVSKSEVCLRMKQYRMALTEEVLRSRPCDCLFPW